LADNDAALYGRTPLRTKVPRGRQVLATVWMDLQASKSVSPFSRLTRSR
jgi:hypothetical protein